MASRDRKKSQTEVGENTGDNFIFAIQSVHFATLAIGQPIFWRSFFTCECPGWNSSVSMTLTFGAL